MTAVTGAKDSVCAQLPRRTAGAVDPAGSTNTTEYRRGGRRPLTPSRLPAGSTEKAGKPCPSWSAVRRHRQASEPLCEACREFHRDYYREYERTRRQSAVARERLAVAKQRWRDRNPAAIRAYSRRRYRQQLAELRNYVDPIVVERLIRGEAANPTRRERLEAVGLLRARGASYSVIAARLSMSERQVHRDLRDLGLVNAA